MKDWSDTRNGSSRFHSQKYLPGYSKTYICKKVIIPGNITLRRSPLVLYSEKMWGGRLCRFGVHEEETAGCIDTMIAQGVACQLDLYD